MTEDDRKARAVAAQNKTCRCWPSRHIICAWGPLTCVGCGHHNQHRQSFGVCSRSAPRSLMMSMLMWPLAVWGVLTAVLIILLIYRSTLTMQEDDQLFLGESESHMEKEQIEIMAKVNKITPVVKWLGAASGLLILVIAGVAVYQGLQQVQ